MRVRIALYSALVLASLGSVPCLADQTFVRPPSKVLGAQPKVAGNSYPVGGESWPATLISILDNPVWPLRCTSTLIGPRVVLSAAHCISEDGSTMRIDLGTGPIAVVCTRHGDYDPLDHYRNDVALCLAPAPIALGTGDRYERVNTDVAVPPKGAIVRLLGYGCTVPGGATSDSLYSGTTLAQDREPAQIKLAGGDGAVLCEGDSGGAAYAETPPAGPVRRVVLGVNSTRGPDFRSSTVTDLAAPQIADFLKTWSNANGVAICGYDAPPTLCYP